MKKVQELHVIYKGKIASVNDRLGFSRRTKKAYPRQPYANFKKALAWEIKIAMGVCTPWPYQMTFLFNAGWRNENIEIGFRHYCMHPVVPFLELTGAPTQNWECSYDELFIRVHGRLPLIKRKEDRGIEARK